MKVKLRPHNQPPLAHFTQAPLCTTMVAVCTVRERRHQACRIATWHWHSCQAKVFPTDAAVVVVVAASFVPCAMS